jgi:uncharacterized membrane protein
MNPLVKKEIRLLLRNFCITLFLALSFWLVPRDAGSTISNLAQVLKIFPCWICPLAFVLLALTPFGSEFTHGTFSTLLIQPVERRRVWRIKIGLLALMTVLIWFVWMISFILHGEISISAADLWQIEIMSVLLTLTIFSGGLWASLLCRQVIAGFWITILTPLLILMIAAYFLDDQSDRVCKVVYITLFSIYSLTGFGLAWWLFLRAQDVKRRDVSITLPGIRLWNGTKAKDSSHSIQHPFTVQFFKELQLYQAQFLIAGLLLALNLVVLAMLHWVHFEPGSTTKMILENCWCLWLVMPLLIGCRAVAEERSLGMMGSQFCLPVRRRSLFAIKLLVALGLSLTLGWGIPLLLGGKNVPLSWSGMAGMVLLIGMVSFYFSSLMRNLLETIAPAIGGFFLSWLLIFLLWVNWTEVSFYSITDFLWRGKLAFWIVCPALAVTLLILAYRNSQCLRPTQKTGWKNLLVFLTVLVLGIGTSMAVYHRFWERFTPFELPHGAARLSMLPAGSLNSHANDLSLRVPEGRIWATVIGPETNRTPRRTHYLNNWKLTASGGRWISGSNWLNLAATPAGIIGIRSDGTLWTLEQKRPQKNKGPILWDYSVPFVPYGSETNWSSAALYYDSILLTKNDGSLWDWDITEKGSDHKTHYGFHISTPRRLGTESDWTGVSQRTGLCLRKKDGSLWSNLLWPINGLATREITAKNRTVAMLPSVNSISCHNIAKIGYWQECLISLEHDGTLRIRAKEHPLHVYHTFVWQAANLQLGTETNWVDMIPVQWGKVVTLKSDGSLWLWDFRRRLFWQAEATDEKRILETVPQRLGTHSDWMAMTGYPGGDMVTLAADGSLWFWPIGSVNPHYYWTDGTQPAPLPAPLLAHSAKPQLLGNVLDRQN